MAKPQAAPAAGRVVAELRATLALALPLAGAQLAQIAMSFTAAAMMGRLGGDALAAGGLASGLAFTIVLICQGLLTAVGPLAAHALGAGEERRVGAIVGHGLLLAGLLSLAGMALVSQIPAALAAVGHAPPLVAATGRYLGAALWGIPAALGYAVLRSYLAAISRTLPLMTVLVLCLALNVLLNYGLIFGHFGLPALGLAGSGCANAIVQWVQFGALALYVTGRRGHGIFGAMLRPARHQAMALVHLGWPIAGIFALEAGVFSTAGVLAGLLGARSLAAHQLAISVSGITFMVPLALSHAATVRVARASGAGDTAAARLAGMVAIGCGTLFMMVVGIVLLTTPLTIVALYLDLADPANATVIPIALNLLFITALFEVFDGGQVIAGGALRGLRDTRSPLVIAIVGYWGVGFACAWLLAFPLGLGAPGLWWGLALGLAFVAIGLCLRFRRLTAA